MAKLIRWTFLLSMNVLLTQISYSFGFPFAIPSIFIPGINIGDMALDQIDILVYGRVDKTQIIMNRQLEHIQITKAILSLTQLIAESSSNAPEMTALIRSLQSLPKHLNTIDEAFRQYEAFVNSKKPPRPYKVKKFAMYADDRFAGPLKEVLDLYSIIISTGDRIANKNDYSLLSLISRQMKGYNKLCNKYESQLQMMQTILNTITAAELKTYLVMEFAIQKLDEMEEVDYEEEMEQLKQDLEKRYKPLIDTFQMHMKSASLDIWRCDPNQHVEGETYFKLDNLFQVYIVRDSDLNYASDCYNTCSDYSRKVKETSCFHPDEGYEDPDTNYLEYSVCQSVRPCKGLLYGCSDRFLAFKELWTCPANQEVNGTRRYDFISHGYISKGWFGGREIHRYGPMRDDGPCKQKLTYNNRDLYNFRVCELCSCVCDDSPAPYSDKNINMRPVTADKDYVVTGIRWVKEDQTLNLQIEQGKLLAHGKVDPSTVHWKDIQKPREKSPDDIRNFDWDALRGFLLEDVKVSESNVVAGVKIGITSNNDTSLLTLQLLPLQFEHKTGKLNYRTPFYEDPDGAQNQEGVWDPVIKLPAKFGKDDAVQLGEAKLPTHTTIKSVPEDKKKYVLLTTSHFQTDLGQSTVPFFDMQQNILNIPAPLSGIGIYYKKQKDGYAGFLALKLLSYNSAMNVIVEKD